MSGRDQYVGRVGALAVALGVGAVVVALPAVAAAESGDTATTPTRPVAGPSQSSTEATPSRVNRHRAASRSDFADRASNDSPAATAPAASAANSALPAPLRRPRTVTVPVATVPAATVDPVVPVLTPVPTPALPAAAHAPRIAAAVTPGSVSGVRSALLRLLGADPSAPAGAPLAWSALAVSRRERVIADVTPTAAVAAAATYDDVTAAITNGGSAWTTAQTSYTSFQNFFAGIPAGHVQQWLFSQMSASLTTNVTEMIRRDFGDLAPIAGTLAPIVVAGFGDWIANGTVAPEIDRIATDPTVLSFVAAWTAQGVTDLGVPPAVSAVVGDAVASLVRNVFGGPANAAVRAVGDAVLASLPGSPSGWSDTELLYQLWRGNYSFGQLIDNQISPQALGGITTLFSAPAVQHALGDALSSAVGILADSDAVAAYVGDEITAWLVPDLGVGIAGAIGDAVAGLVPALGGGLGAVAGAALTAFLAQPGVAVALGDAAGQLATVYWADGDVEQAFYALLPSLESSPVLMGGLAGTIAAVAHTVDTALIGNPVVAQALGAAVTGLVTDLTADPAAWAEISAVISELLPSTGIFGSLATMLADPAVAAGLAGVAGDAVTVFLGYPGVSTVIVDLAAQVGIAALAGADVDTEVMSALQSLQDAPAVQGALVAVIGVLLPVLNSPATGAPLTTFLVSLTTDPVMRDTISDTLGFGVLDLLDQLGPGFTDALIPAISDLLGTPGVGEVLGGVITALLSGDDPTAALQDVLQALQADPTLADTLGTAVSGAVNSVLEDAAVRQAIGDVVTALLPLGPVPSQIAGVAITVLLANPIVGTVFGDIAVDILGGLPLDQLPNVLIATVLTRGALHNALGFAIGQGIGSLAGNNIVGAILGNVAGMAVTAVIKIAAVFTLLVNPGVAAAAAPRSGTSPAAALWWLPVSAA